jgi:hypothetical protein
MTVRSGKVCSWGRLARHSITRRPIDLLGRHCTLTRDPHSLRWQRRRGSCRPLRREVVFPPSDALYVKAFYPISRPRLVLGPRSPVTRRVAGVCIGAGFRRTWIYRVLLTPAVGCAHSRLLHQRWRLHILTVVEFSTATMLGRILVANPRRHTRLYCHPSQYR